MAPPELQVAIEEVDGVVRVICSGEVDILTAPSLEEALRDAYTRSAASLQLDLRGVTFFDSQGVRVLVAMTRRAGESGVPISVTASPIVRRVIEVSGIAGWVDLQPEA